MCEMWVGDKTDCNVSTPSSSDYSSTSFSFCWAAQPGSWGPQALCLELVLTASNSNCNWLQLTQAICGTWLYNCFITTCFLWASQLHWIQPVHRSRWYPDVFNQMHLFLDWRLGQGSICYNTFQINISMMWNASRFVQGLNLGHPFHFLWW